MGPILPKDDPELTAVLRERLGRLLEAKPNSTARVGWSDVDTAMAELEPVRGRLAPLVRDTGQLTRSALAEGKRVMFEGGQGTMLDVTYGTYPYVTSSHPTVGGIIVGAGVSHKALDKVYGVVKATEIEDEATALRLRGSGSNQWDEYGTTTGRARRVGWLDLAQLRYACDLNGFDGLVVTKLDVLSGLDGVQVCVAYDDGGAPVYRQLAGWGDLRGLGSRAALPREVVAYLELIEEVTGTPVAMFSTSPDREDTFGSVVW